MVAYALAMPGADAGWLRRLKQAASNGPLGGTLETLPDADGPSIPGIAATTVLWSIRRPVAPGVDPGELFFASGNVLNWLGQIFLADEVAAVLVPLFAERWTDVAEHQRFRLRAPSVTADPILGAARNCANRRQFAQLVLAAHPAVRVAVASEMLGEWRKIAAA